MEIQLLIQLYNKFNCWYVQGLKLGCVISAIFHGYLGIRVRQNNLLIAAFCVVIHAAAVVAYCGAFHRAYRLRKRQMGLKREVEIACAKISSRTGEVVRQETMKAIKALSCPGLKVGGFHEMERQTALMFIGFVESQMISLLVAF